MGLYCIELNRLFQRKQTPVQPHWRGGGIPYIPHTHSTPIFQKLAVEDLKPFLLPSVYEIRRYTST